MDDRPDHLLHMRVNQQHQRARSLPLGEGVVAREIRCRPETHQKIAAILLAYDGLGSLHGDGERVVVISTQDQSQVLDEVLASMKASGLDFAAVPFDNQTKTEA
jgi:hypothetical protein